MEDNNSIEKGELIEKEIEKYLTENNIKYIPHYNIIGKFKLDFLLNNNIHLEIKSYSNITAQTSLMSRGNYVNQIFKKLYPESINKTIIIIKKENNISYSPSLFLFGNMIYDLCIPFEYKDYILKYLNSMSKEEILFSIMDDMFTKEYNININGSFPYRLYYFLLSVERGTYNNVYDFYKKEIYYNKQDIYVSNYMHYINKYIYMLEKLNIIKDINVVSSFKRTYNNSNIIINNNKWRYFVYIMIISKGPFYNNSIEINKELWDRILHIFS